MLYDTQEAHRLKNEPHMIDVWPGPTPAAAARAGVNKEHRLAARQGFDANSTGLSGMERSEPTSSA